MNLYMGLFGGEFRGVHFVFELLVSAGMKADRLECP